MKCIIVDDEPLAREGMELNIQQLPFLELLGQFGNAVAANDFLSKTKVDLMFLDIEMPGISGLDFIRSLKNQPLIILTTAYPQYALEGFELAVIDYLVKPIRMERFIKSVNKAKEFYDLKSSSNNSVESIEQDFIYIKSDRKFIRLFYKDIFYIKGMKDYVMIFTEEKRLITAMNISTISKQLPSSIFTRVSKSYMINIQYIDAVEQDLIQLAGEQIPLGRTYKEGFINNYVKKNLIGRK